MTDSVHKTPDLFRFRVEPRTVAVFFVWAITALTLAHLGLMGFTAVTGHDHLMGFIALLNTDEEGNIPTFYSAVTLLLASVLLALHAAEARRHLPREYRYWMGMSVIFAYVAVDEAARIHELLTGVMRRLFGIGGEGYLFLSWVVPVGIAVLVLGIVYLRFFLRLPIRLQRLGAISAFVFLSGALGCELIESRLLSDPGIQGRGYSAVSTIEEFLEMCGVAIWNYALIDNLARTGFRLQVSFTNPKLVSSAREEELTGPRW